VSEDIFQRLKKMISDHLGVEEAEISEESHLQEDLNADPLSTADLIVDLEKEFEVDISQDVSSQFQTVGDILNVITDKTGEI
jgi:acyl carrier protein